MTDQKPNNAGEAPSKQKENNPFSEQDKHGEKAQRQAPGFQQDYQGGQPEERRKPGVDTEDVRKSA